VFAQEYNTSSKAAAVERTMAAWDLGLTALVDSDRPSIEGGESLVM
jgi:hypothetical protein